MVENFLRGHLVAVLHAVVAGRCLLVDFAGVGVHVEELARREDLPRPRFVLALEHDAVEDFDIIEACDELVAVLRIEGVDSITCDTDCAVLLKFQRDVIEVAAG